MKRRNFLNTSLAMAGIMVIPRHVLGGTGFTAPSDQLNKAIIGVGGMGRGHIPYEDTRVVAICDVDKQQLNRAAALVPDAHCYTDWREMLIKEGNKIDSVNVTVPDHLHALISLSAIQAGKHVYCQKPLCHDVAECRTLAQAAKRSGLVTQLGTQHASGIGDRLGVQWLREGAVGKIQRIILCSNRPGAIDAYRLLGPRPTQKEQAPAHLAWDLWLGNAPVRAYAPSIYHPSKWRAWQDFGTGWLGDIGCHIFDAVWKGLELHAPLSVVAEVQESWKNDAARRADVWPQSDHVTWVFPGNEKSGGKDFTIEWFDGLLYPPAEVQALVKEAGFNEYPAESAMVIGSDGAMLLPHTSGPILLPKAKFMGRIKPKLAGRNHYHHFLDAILGGEMCESHFVQTGPMAEAILLGTVAIRVPNTLLQWDARRLTIQNNIEANRFLGREYRKGWELPTSS